MIIHLYNQLGGVNIANDIENYYRKKSNEGKHHYAAIVACTTKLLQKNFSLV